MTLTVTTWTDHYPARPRLGRTASGRGIRLLLRYWRRHWAQHRRLSWIRAEVRDPAILADLGLGPMEPSGLERLMRMMMAQRLP